MTRRHEAPRFLLEDKAVRRVLKNVKAYAFYVLEC